MAIRFAKRMEALNGSEIRELLKLIEKPEVISFAGGLPAPELFPIEEMKEISRIVLEESGTQALQYSTTEGFQPLREKIARRMNSKNKTNVTKDDILITNGSKPSLVMKSGLFIPVASAIGNIRIKGLAEAGGEINYSSFISP